MNQLVWNIRRVLLPLLIFPMFFSGLNESNRQSWLVSLHPLTAYIPRNKGLIFGLIKGHLMVNKPLIMPFAWGVGWPAPRQPIGAQANQMGDNLSPINLGTGKTATHVVCGSGFTCALLAGSKSVKCWGRNEYGYLAIDEASGRWFLQSKTCTRCAPSLSFEMG